VLAFGVSVIALPERTLCLPPLLAVLGAGFAVATSRASRAQRLVTVATAGAVMAGWVWPPWHLDVSPHKALPQIEAMPGAERILDGPHPAGWVSAVRSPAFRYAPGLSLGYRGDIPNPTALFVDGELAGVVFDSDAPELYDWLPSAAAYALGRTPNVLVLGAGGGSEVRSAVHHGAARITAVEGSPGVVGLLRALQDQGLRSNGAPVEWTSSDARSYVARTEERFDLITVQLSGSPGGQAGGLLSLNEDFLHTVDAYRAYLDLLAPGGVLTVNSWLTLPPRRSVRMVLTAGAALRDRGHIPERSVLLLRSWATVTLVVKPDGLTERDVAAVRDWAERRQFDVDWYPGMTIPASVFHQLDDAALFDAVRAVADGDAAAHAFADAYPFDVTPVTDARPFPDHFLRPAGLWTVLHAGPGGALPVAELGLVAVIATLAQAVVVGAILLLVPASVASVRRGRGLSVPLTVYFVAIGLGYMLVEIAAIQQLTLLLGQPVYAVTAVLVTVLVCSGAGSIWSDRFEWRRLRWVTFAVAATCVAYAVTLLPLVHVAQPFGLAVRAALALVAIAPAAVLMGMPFPVGLRRLAGDHPVDRAWAWAANGFASVVATPLAMLVALEWGSRVLLLFGAAAYSVASLKFGTSSRSRERRQDQLV
jgi:spermidine synthase